MKIVIIEGPDNVGKTTVINSLIARYSSVYYIHCQKPDEQDPIKAALAQVDNFEHICDNIRRIFESEIHPKCIILDRSWIGEYVYGCLYRGNGDEFVIDMIERCNNFMNHLYKNFNNVHIDVKYILLTASQPAFCIKNEDGQSLSKGDVEKVLKELERFNYIFNYDFVNEIDKKIIVVNDGMNFRDKETILKEIVNFIDNDERTIDN